MSGTAARRAWRLPLPVHAVLLVVVLAVIAPFLHLEDTYTSDEGAYAIQVRDLDDGHWEYPYAAERYDPEGRWFPLANANRSSEGWFSYVQHPAYPVLLLAATKVVGRVLGLHLAALTGAVGVAVAAWLLAAEVEAAAWARRAAFWLAAGGPVAVHAYIQWAHALSAAVAGFTLVAAVRLARPDATSRRWPAVAGLAAGSAAGVLLRSEGVLFAVALAGGLSLAGLRGRTTALRVGIPVLCLGVAGAAALAEQRWIESILGQPAAFRTTRDTVPAPGGAAAGGGPVDWAGGRVAGAFHTLLQGAHREPALSALVLAALAMLAYGAWSFHRRRTGWERDVAIGLVAAAAIYAVRAYADRTEAMTGIFAAWPLALLGLAVLGRALQPPARLLAAVCGLYLVAVLATQYRVGGGLEWGGRFLAPLYAPVAVLACLGLARLLAALPPPPDARRRAIVGGVAVLACLPLLTGLVLLESLRSYSGRLIDEVTAAAPPGGPQLVVTDLVALPRAAWRTHPRVGWMLVTEDDLDDVTAALLAGGARQVTVLVGAGAADPSSFAAFPTVKDVTGPAARAGGRRTFELSAP